MKPPSVARLCLAGLVTTSLVGGALGVGALTPAYALTDTVAAPLPAPAVVGPNDGTVRKTVVLDWSPVAGASGYKVEVGRDATWSDAPVLSTTTTASELTLPVGLPHGTYVWRVAALSGSTPGHWTSETADLQFVRGWSDTPTPLTPTGAVGARPEFSWTPVPSASAYEVQVTNTAFVQPSGVQEQPPGSVDTCYTQRTRVTFFTEQAQQGESNAGPCTSTLLGGGNQLYWRVRAVDRYNGGTTSWQTAPAAGAISDYKPSGTPDPKVDAACPGDTGGGCAPSSSDVEFGSWSAVTPFTATGVAPVGSYNAATPVVVHALTTDPDHLCTANTPSAGVTTCTDFPTLSWDAAPGALRYRVTVGLDAAMSNVQRIVDTAGLRWTPTDSWADAGSPLYYAVQACDANGCGVVGAAASFRKVSPRASITSPVPSARDEYHLGWASYADQLAAAATAVAGSPVKATQDAFAYHVEVAPADHPSYDVRALETVVDQTTLDPGTTLPDGSYVWRVQAVDASGHTLPWSASQAFVRDTTPPVLVGVAPSTNVADTAPLALTFSEPVLGLSSANVTLSPAAATSLTVTGPSTATLTPTTPLRPGQTYSIAVGPSVTDVYGNVAVPSGPSFSVNPKVDDRDKAVGYRGTWRLLSSSNASFRSYHGSVPGPRAQTRATLGFAGVGAAVYGCMGPADGYLDVYVDGVRKARVSLYRSFSGCGVRLAAVGKLARGAHSLTLVGIGAHVRASKGNAVAVDGVAVSP